MPARHDLSSFIRSTFRSVWALELACFLRKAPNRDWYPEELVTALRASDLVIEQSVAGLTAAGLVITRSDGAVRYQPANASLDALVREVEAEYASSPDKIRRLIVSGTASGLAAFAEAFRVWKD